MYRHNSLILFLDMDWLSFATYITDAVICAIKTIIFWFIDTVLVLLEPLLYTAFSGITGYQNTFNDVNSILSKANYFLPVSNAIDLALGLITFLVLYSAVKLTVKLIPMIG